MKTLKNIPVFHGIFRIITLTVLTVTLAGCMNQEDQASLLFFYLESCPSCDDYKKAEELSELLEKMDKSRQWKTGSYNLAIPENMPKLKATLEEMALPDISRSLPLLILDDTYINGYEEIEKTLLDLSVQEKK